MTRFFALLTLLLAAPAIAGPYRLIDLPSATDAVFDGITATDCARDCIRIQTANHVTIRNFKLQHAPEPSTQANLPEGIAIYYGLKNTISDGEVSGFKTIPDGKYPNGDGIATEGGTGGTISRVYSHDNSDAGFDIKGSWVLNDTVSERNGRNYRFWNDQLHGTLTSRDGGAAVWIGKNATVRIKMLIASSTVPANVLSLAGASTAIIDACDLTGMAPGSRLYVQDNGGNHVTWGVGCKLP